MTELLQLIKGRKSVRTFDGNPVRPEDREKLAGFIRAIESPFGIPVRFVLLDAGENGLSSPVIIGESLYVAGIVPAVPGAEAAYGYAFEKLVLYAESLGLGTTWIAGTMNRQAFEKAMQLQADEVMPCVSPIGCPAKKMSLRETMMRKAVRADSRMEFSDLFFDGSFDRLLSENTPYRDALEMVRWAPSAVNKQPWRAVISGRQAHFYERKSKGYTDATGWDLQKVDMGIALCHFSLGLEDRVSLTIADPGLSVPEDTDYIATLTDLR